MLQKRVLGGGRADSDWRLVCLRGSATFRAGRRAEGETPKRAAEKCLLQAVPDI